ncbi:MAG: hypothetical protein V3T17_06685 [Pseudomonadales bacterium]
MRVETLLLLTIFLTPSASAVQIGSIQTSASPDNQGFYTVVINGSSFGGGPEMVLYDDFSSGTVGSVVSLNSPLIGTWSNSSDYNGKPKVVAHNNGKAMQIHDFSQGYSMNRIAQLEAILPRRDNTLFFSYSVTVPQGRFFSGASSDNTFPSPSSWKMTWIADGPGAIQTDNRFDFCVPTHVEW